MYYIKRAALFFLWMAVAIQGAPHTYIAVFSPGQALGDIFPDKAPSQAPAKRPQVISVGVFPVSTRDYKESIPCDSCHWLSPQGVRFALENYFLGMIDSLVPNSRVQLLAPHQELVKGKNLQLLKALDSLPFPFDQWFDSYQQDLIYRPKDRYTPRLLKEELNRLGGALGFSHLLIPTGFQMRIYPKKSDDHVGKFELSFFLVFWNVPLAYPEWVLFFKNKTKKVDLDAPLKKYLDKSVWKRLQQVSEEVRELLAKEQR